MWLMKISKKTLSIYSRRILLPALLIFMVTLFESPKSVADEIDDITLDVDAVNEVVSAATGFRIETQNIVKSLTFKVNDSVRVHEVWFHAPPFQVQNYVSDGDVKEYPFCQQIRHYLKIITSTSEDDTGLQVLQSHHRKDRFFANIDGDQNCDAINDWVFFTHDIKNLEYIGRFLEWGRVLIDTVRKEPSQFCVEARPSDKEACKALVEYLVETSTNQFSGFSTGRENEEACELDNLYVWITTDNGTIFSLCVTFGSSTEEWIPVRWLQSSINI